MARALHVADKPHAESSAEVAERLFELSSDMLGTASTDGYLTRVNPAWEQTLGWTRAELMSEPFIWFVHPEDVEATTAAAAALAGPGRQHLVNFENRYRTSAGEYRWLQWSSDAEGGTIYFVAKDVTARKTLEAVHDEDLLRLRRSEARHRTLSANLPDSTVFLLDHDLRILLAEGEAVGRLPWFSEDLFVGRMVSDLYASVPADVLDLAIENYTAVLQGERRSFEFASDGTRFAVDGVPVLSDDGVVDAALIVARDVTEQWRLTDGLRRSERSLRTAERLVSGGSWELSLDEQTMMWSDGLGQIHGDVPAAGLEPLSAYVERIVAADRPHFRDELARCAETGRADFEYRVARPDGSVRTLTVAAEMADLSGGESRVLRGAALDVTDERAGFDGAPIGMLVSEPEHMRILRVNDAMCSLLNRPREEVLGQRTSDFTHSDDLASAAERRRALLDRTAGTYEAEKRYLRPDGSAVWTSIYVTALHNTDGSVREFSTQVVDITDRRNRTLALESARMESLRRLATVSGYRDNETHEHTERVGRTAVMIGRVLGMSETQLDSLRQAAPLHDIGKIGIPDAILLKPGRLTKQERRTMERHTLIGADILSNSGSPVVALAEEIALTHHERWDGQGYPNRLTAEAIPLVGRIVAIADVFDALTHERPYKEAWPVDRAVAHILGESGLQFDPSVVAAFAALDPAALVSPDRHARLEAYVDAQPECAELGLARVMSVPEDDVRAPDRDHAAADRDRAATARDQSAAGRDRSEAEADERTSHRDSAACDRETAAMNRDHIATVRDETQSDADQLDVNADQRTSDRAQAVDDRWRAALDRDHTATDRDHAHAEAGQRNRNRDYAAADRVLAAADRAQTAADRRAATIDRDLARDLRRRAQVDQLTGALGRELGVVALGREINRARRGNGKLVLAVVEVNGLTEVNKLRGYASGDLLLKQVMEAMHTTLRSYDLIVRFGGDTFMCALSDAMPAEADHRFDAIKSKIAAVHPEALISVGVAALLPTDSLDDLMSRGDAALHRVKAET